MPATPKRIQLLFPVPPSTPHKNREHISAILKASSRYHLFVKKSTSISEKRKNKPKPISRDAA